MKTRYTDEKELYKYLHDKGQKYRKKFLSAPTCAEASKIGLKWVKFVSKVYHKVFKALGLKSSGDTTFFAFDDFVYCSTRGITDTLLDMKSEKEDRLEELKRFLAEADFEECWWDIFDIYSYISVRDANDAYNKEELK